MLVHRGAVRSTIALCLVHFGAVRSAVAACAAGLAKGLLAGRPGIAPQLAPQKLGLLINFFISLIGLFSDLEALSSGDFRLNFSLTTLKKALKSLNENAPNSICLRVIIFNVLLILLCLVIYYGFLRKWTWAKFRLSRRAFGIVFGCLGFLSLWYGQGWLWFAHVQESNAKWFLWVSFLSLIYTIFVTLVPGRVWFRKVYARFARWYHRLNYVVQHRRWKEGQNTP